MTVINSNIKSLVAQQALSANNKALTKAMEQLSTGKRINTAADDAAGIAIASKMTAQIKGLNVAVRNVNDAISLAQTMEGALDEVTNMVQRIRELGLQAANGTYSTSDRAALNAEYDALTSEIARVADKTTWNGTNFLGAGATSVAFQIGPDANTTATLTFSDIDTSMAGVSNLVLAANGVSSVAEASAAIGYADDALSQINTLRSNIGAFVNRLNYAADNLANVAANTAASRSRIQDTDYAQATTELAKRQIIQQAATAMLAQANQQPASVLSLLQ
jgi:flagellin